MCDALEAADRSGALCASLTLYRSAPVRSTLSAAAVLSSAFSGPASGSARGQRRGAAEARSTLVTGREQCVFSSLSFEREKEQEITVRAARILYRTRMENNTKSLCIQCWHPAAHMNMAERER